MPSPTALRIEVVSNQNQFKYFKLMEVFYKILHISCSLDFGFFKHKSIKQRIFWKAFSIVQFIAFCSLSCMIIDIQSKSVFDQFVQCFFIAHGFCNVLILALINPYRSFYNFFSDIESIDSKMGINNSFINLEIKIFVTGIVFPAFKALMMLNVKSRLIIVLPRTLILSSSHAVLISYTFLFYAINCRLKKLVSIVKTADSDFSKLQSIYKSIVELTEKYKATFEPLYTNALLFYTYLVMKTIYNIVLRINEEVYENAALVRYVLSAELLVHIFAPAIAAGMLATQAERMKIILLDKLMPVRDEPIIRDMVRFTRYLQARDCRLRVYKVVPLDADLLGMVLGFCATYLIVIIQFALK